MYHHDGGVDGIAEDLRKALDESLHLRLNLELYNSNGVKPPTPDPVTPSPTPKPESKVEPQRTEKKSSLTQTPLMTQYQEMKKKYPDAVLLFRVGDFYEIFGKDAVTASEILGITLTRRANGKEKYIELAGFPHHALDTYLPKLVRAGQRVAICEQLEDPKLKKTIEHRVVEDIRPAEQSKMESKPEPTPNKPPKPEPAPAEPPKLEPAKEIETDGSPDYNDNPDPRLYAYNLFGELEPIGKPRRQPKPAEDAPKPKPSVEVKDIPVKKSRPLTEKELEFYGSLNWEDNPPINGFYETMMSIAHRQLEEMRLEREAEEAAKAANGELINENGTVIERTEGDFIPGRKPRVAAEKVEVDMSPRPFSEDIQFFHHNGSMVVQDGLVGFLSEVRKNGATFNPLSLKPEQANAPCSMLPCRKHIRSSTITRLKHMRQVPNCANTSISITMSLWIGLAISMRNRMSSLFSWMPTVVTRLLWNVAITVSS